MKLPSQISYASPLGPRRVKRYLFEHALGTLTVEVSESANRIDITVDGARVKRLSPDFLQRAGEWYWAFALPLMRDQRPKSITYKDGRLRSVLMPDLSWIDFVI